MGNCPHLHCLCSQKHSYQNYRFCSGTFSGSCFDCLKKPRCILRFIKKGKIFSTEGLYYVIANTYLHGSCNIKSFPNFLKYFNLLIVNLNSSHKLEQQEILSICRIMNQKEIAFSTCQQRLGSRCYLSLRDLFSCSQSFLKAAHFLM